MRNEPTPAYLPNAPPQGLGDDQDFVTPIVVRKGRGQGTVSALQVVGAMTFILIAAMLPFATAFGTWAARQSLRREAVPPGPACPRVAKLSIAAMGAKPPKPFDYKGSHFAFQIGDVSCDAAPLGWFGKQTFAACHFDAPGGIVVTTGGRTTIFEPGVGHSATVAVRPEGTTCVIGGEYRVPDHPAWMDAGS
ncbi:hypothetical protein [Phenylobacterium sp.]|jgi:hypothetical protein|uniref:hypothetical protein n=1 Tax=Phenylobacterium sp. TaxID=1871053 RepID=UPI002F401E96